MLKLPTSPLWLLLSLSVFLNACKPSATETDTTPQAEVPRPAKIALVRPAGVEVIRNYPGVLEAAQQAELSFRVSGKLNRLVAQDGLEVKRGNLLARLDQDEFKNALEDAKARVELAQIQFDQASKLQKQKLGSQIALDEARVNLRVAKTGLKTAQDNLNYSSLRAPFSGTVGKVDIENYQTVSAQTPIIWLQNADKLDFRFNVPESLITQLRKVQDPKVMEKHCGMVRFNSRPEDPIKACYKKHEALADEVTRTYAVTFNLKESKDFPILPGMSATLNVDISMLLPEQNEQEVLIPVEALLERHGKSYVWVVNTEQRAKLTEVSVASIADDSVVVSSGISTGQAVIAAGVSYVQADMLVTPLTKERGL